MTKHSKQNSCEQRGISVRSVSRCKQMLHWSSTSSSPSFSSKRSSFERDGSQAGDSSFMRLAGGGESFMCSHTTVAGWVMTDETPRSLRHHAYRRSRMAWPTPHPGRCIHFKSMLLPKTLGTKFKYVRQQPENFC